MPFFWNWTGKEAIKVFPWKWVIIGIASLLLLGAGTYGVYSYRSAIEERDQLKEQKRVVEEAFEAETQKSARLTRDMERMSDYMETAELARLQLENRLKTVATRKVKRDEKGNIAPDDDLLADLRGMFPPGSQAGAVRPDNTPAPAVPR